MFFISYYYSKTNWILLLIFCLSLSNCIPQDNRWLDEKKADAQLKRIKYNLQVPDRKIKLHYDLEEISGLTYVAPDRLACVQDELGRVFYFNLQTEKIENEVKFSKSGDFEGIEHVNGTIYVSRNDGTLFSFPFGPNDPEKELIKKLDNPLSSKNDVEGLGYLPKSNALLLACKGTAEITSDNIKGRAIYAFDLNTNILSTKPLFSIQRKDVTNFVQNYKSNYNLTKSPDFRPSAIAVHPITYDIYLLTSVGKSLIILNNKGEIKDVAFLSSKVFKQPEGICFSATGDLYISSEGVGGRGYIMEFTYKGIGK